jgi:hypothetical protein
MSFVNLCLLLIIMKMRQRSALALCTFYLISVIGVALSLHFCAGKLSSVHFTERVMCKVCKMETKPDSSKQCCKNTNVSAKITDSHESASKVSLPQNFSIKLFLTPIFAELFQQILPKLFTKAENKAPPLSARLSLYAYHCVFRN